MIASIVAENINSLTDENYAFATSKRDIIAMLGWLKGLFGRRDRLAHLARQKERRPFIEALGNSNPYVFADMQSEGLDAATFTQEELIEMVERVAKELNERESFDFFSYSRNGSIRVPIFSSMKFAERFCGEYSKAFNRVFPFQCLGVRPAAIADLVGKCDKIVLNDASPEEYTFTRKDEELLMEIWGED